MSNKKAVPTGLDSEALTIWTKQQTLSESNRDIIKPAGSMCPKKKTCGAQGKTQ